MITGSKKIGLAVISTTLTLAAVFVPISFLPGDFGRLFREFGFTLAASVLFSALVALTLTAGSETSRIVAPGLNPAMYVVVNFLERFSVDTLWTLRVQ